MKNKTIENIIGVIEQVEAAEAIVNAVTATGTNPAIEGNAVAIDANGKAIAPQAPLPGTEVALATTKPAAPQGVVLVVNNEIQVNKAVEVFHLESEVVGRPSIRKTVNKKGGVKIDLETAKELGKALGIKGDALKKHVQDLGLGLKSVMAKSVTELQADPTWIGRHMTMAADGKTVTFQLKKVEPIVLAAKQVAAPVLTDEMLAAQLGVTIETIIEMKKDKAAKEAEELAMKQLEAEEAAKLAAAKTPEAPAAE